MLNRAFGTVINAGWGIGMQISGYTNFLASAIVNAMSPVIVKSEGAGDRDSPSSVLCTPAASADEQHDTVNQHSLGHADELPIQGEEAKTVICPSCGEVIRV